MASFALAVVLILSLTSHSSATWCVCKQGADQYLQKTIDYACGNGADCTPIKEGGPCYEPNTMRDHCSYAVNSYYQKKASSGATCDFSQTAQLSTNDPSTPGCSYSSSGGNGGNSPTGNGSGIPSPNGQGTTSPFGSTPTGTGVLGGGGMGNGLGPSGDGGMGTDLSDAGSKLLKTNMVVVSLFMILVSVPAFFMLLWQ